MVVSLDAQLWASAKSMWALPRINSSVLCVSTGEIAGAGAASIMSALTDKAIVKKELLCDVAGKDKYQVNNKHDKEYTPLPLNKIIQQAERLVGQEVLYRLTSENCEHFVNELRYGVPRSDQVCPQSLYLTSQLPVAGPECGWRQNYKQDD